MGCTWASGQSAATAALRPAPRLNRRSTDVMAALLVQATMSATSLSILSISLASLWNNFAMESAASMPFHDSLKGNERQIRTFPVMHDALENEGLRVGGAHVARCTCCDCLAARLLPVSAAHDTARLPCMLKDVDAAWSIHGQKSMDMFVQFDVCPVDTEVVMNLVVRHLGRLVFSGVAVNLVVGRCLIAPARRPVNARGHVGVRNRAS
eukprot:2839169-Prymnesium_polylepis.2